MTHYAYINTSTYIYICSSKPHWFLWDRHYHHHLHMRKPEHREVK